MCTLAGSRTRDRLPMQDPFISVYFLNNRPEPVLTTPYLKRQSRIVGSTPRVFISIHISMLSKFQRNVAVHFEKNKCLNVINFDGEIYGEIVTVHFEKNKCLNMYYQL
jgi:hypothetical protein